MKNLVWLVFLSAGTLLGQLADYQFTTVAGWPARTLAFTFDDGPELAGYTTQLARFLHDYRTPDGKAASIEAVFFINGCRIINQTDPARPLSPFNGNCSDWGRETETLLDDMVAQGHALGHHTYDHEDLTDKRLPSSERLKQLLDLLALLRRHWQPALILFRAPYFEWGPAQAAELNADAAIRASGLWGPISADFCGNGQLADGTIVAGDWDCLRTHTPEQCAAPYVAAIAESPNQSGVILIHDRQQFVGASDKPQRIVAEILRQLPPTEYNYVRLDKLLAILTTQQ